MLGSGHFPARADGTEMFGIMLGIGHSVKAGMRNGMEHGTEYGTEYGMAKLVLRESC